MSRKNGERHPLRDPQSPRLTPQFKERGRKASLTREQEDELERFVTSSPQAREMTYEELATHLNFGVGPECIRSTLKRLGYARHPAVKKPELSEANKQQRLRFALEHVNWTKEQWESVLWSDETYIQAGPQGRRIFVTRKKDETYDPTCIAPTPKRGNGIMFWASFAGTRKGPSLIWKKEWGSITAEQYTARVVPLVREFLAQNPGHLFMHDDAPAHAASHTVEALRVYRITPIEWPPNSPDLHPMESVWNAINDYIERHFPRKMSEQELVKAIQEAWEAIEAESFDALVDSMRRRCEKVIEREGGCID
ncbi:hypothetical protein VTN31DRAFT_5217 [Thermomyces dupontii]|uniref:uncharacterized protein n=1 Tax=Talaromyces thermophilus TaxID=28565 RepID=UPI0037444FCE